MSTLPLKGTVFPEPFYYMVFSVKAAQGSNSNIVKTLFSNEPGSLKSDFEKAFRLRHHGWDLEMPGGYQINLHGIESENNFKRIQVKDNGTLIVQGALISNFLCWGAGEALAETNQSRIHPLALIEFTFNTVIAFNRVLKDIKNPGPTVECLVGFAGLQKDKHYLVNGDIRPMKINTRKAYWKGGENEFTLSFDTTQFKDDRAALGKITYEIIQPIYRMFGFEEDSIPYKLDHEKEGRIISSLEISGVS